MGHHKVIVAGDHAELTLPGEVSEVRGPAGAGDRPVGHLVIEVGQQPAQAVETPEVPEVCPDELLIGKGRGIGHGAAPHLSGQSGTVPADAG